MQIFLVFFLWDSVFSGSERVVFGYDRARILTYIFGILLVKSLVYSSRSIDVAGEISRGDLSNYLTKPISYFRYWFTRDLSSKALNIIFASFEAILLYFLLKPPFFLQSNPLAVLLFLISLIFAIFIYYNLVFLFSMFPFWQPEQAWGAIFLFFIFSDFLGGGIFPIDILPLSFQKILYSTPFPYLLFTPLQIYLGKLTIAQSLKSLFVGGFWALALAILVKRIWNSGLKNYRAEGR